MSDDRQHVAAILTALNTALAPRAAYVRGNVPGLSGQPSTEPDIYVIVDVERRGNTSALRAGRTDRRPIRLTVRGVGKTVAEAQWALYKASDALDGVQLAVDSNVTTPLLLEAAESPALDGGRYSGSLTYTYGI